MKTEKQSQLDEETFKEIGRFVVKFSGLLQALEESTIRLFGFGPDGRRYVLIKASLTDRTANPIASSFFSVYFERWGDDLSDGDKKLLKHLRKEIEALIKERNRLMHDVWLGKTVGGESGPHELARHRLRAHGSGAEFETVDYSPQRLNELATTASRLSSVVYSTSWYSNPNQKQPELELESRICIEKGEIKPMQKKA
jgi:hypothetical protein